MPPTVIKQIKSATAYFDNFLDYISGDADSVDVSSISNSIKEDEQIIHSFKTIPNNFK